MPLVTGTRLGGYEILSLIGQGGMGEVYRARDSRLNRDVAIKVLPADVTADHDRLTRFEREAQVLASLNHTNIAQIHGIDDSSGTPALVMELVEGPTLADRIAQGPIPLDEALAIAKQIAEALEAAHEQGIIHRDLKPANIKVRADGTVKVLDFGLAKAFDPAASTSAGATMSPTLSIHATQAGIILGTAAYMSPEQARGRAVDKRADIWAFGCVLYEMLTCKRAFGGIDVPDTLAGILKEEPNYKALPSSAMSLTSVLRRCLQKDPQQRLRDAGDVQLLLEDGSRGSSPAESSSSIASRWWMAAAAALGLIVGGAAIGLINRSGQPSYRLRVERFELTSSSMHPLSTDPAGANVAISPDGSRIVYTSRGADARLVLRDIERVETKAIVTGESAWDPFFSPDGQQIGYATLDELRRVPAGGGASVKICRVAGVVFGGAAWGPNDAIVFTQAGGLGLFRVSAAGGQPEKLAAPDTTKGEQNYFRPTFLPDGQSVLYSVSVRGGAPRIVARNLKNGTTTTVLEGGFGAQYLTPGYLVYGQNDRLMAVAFDASRVRVTGSPMTLQDNASTKLPAGSATNLAIASDGTVLYVAGSDVARPRRVVWVDRRGTHMGPIAEQLLQFPRYPRLSPDGRRLALTIGPLNAGNIWIYDLAGGAQSLKLTFHDHNLFPIWSSDGQRILFVSRAGSDRLLSVPANGTAVEPEPLLTTEEPHVPLDWSPDGQTVLLSRTSAQTRSDLMLLSMSDRITHPWLVTPFAEGEARFSTDGRWVAYTSDQTGRSEIWVRPFPGPGAPVRVSADGGQDPVWSHGGKELFFRSSMKILSAPILSTAPELRVDTPRVLFEGGFEPGSQRAFDVAPDGRFLMIEATTTDFSHSIVVVRNWAEELKARVPTK